jgi:hypothetical protein
MYDTEVSADVGISEIRALQLLVLLVGEVSHRSLELCDDGARGQIACSQNTQFGLARVV